MTMTEYERNALRAIEQELIDSDPAFARRMTVRDPAARQPFPVLSALGALTYILLPIEALLFGWRGALATLAVVALITASVLAGRWCQGRGGR
jgi:hypothetical protein